MTAIDLDAEELARATKRSPERVRAIAKEVDPDGPIATLVTALAEPDPKRRVALSNEALHEIATALSWGEAVPGASLRLAAFATLLAIALVVITRGELTHHLKDLLALGGGAAVFALSARREADRVAAKTRSAVDALVNATGGRGGAETGASR